MIDHRTRQPGLRVGVQLPQWGENASRDVLISLARQAEAAGFDSVWASDHIVYPLTGETAYPNATGRPPFLPEDGYLEALTTLAVLAGATERIRLGTSVLVLPLRETLLLAKTLATLDVLSQGRLVLAVASGWWKAEFEALGADFEHRGERLDEQLEALKVLWDEGTGEMRGNQVRFPPVTVQPSPWQVGGPEIWIGGGGPRVWRRIAQSDLVVGWHGVGHDPKGIATARVGITKACETSGRDPASVMYSTATGMPNDPDRLIDRLTGLAEIGVAQVVLIPRTDDRESILQSIATYGESVRPKLSELLAGSH